MTTWILLIFLFTPNGGVVRATAEFTSEVACEHAKGKVLSTGWNIEATCFSQLRDPPNK